MIHFKLKLPPFTLKRSLPTQWHDMRQAEKIEAVGFLAIYGDQEGRVKYLRKCLKLPNLLKKFLSQEDEADLLQHLAFMNLEASSTPIFDTFAQNKVHYYLPKTDFVNGSAIEFILALDYYQEYGENQDTDYLLKLVAVLAREKRENEADNVKFGDIRVPIHDNSDEAELRALKFKDLPKEIIIAVLRYFEGVKQLIHDLGVESELWKNPKEGDEGKNTEGVALFGWRTVLRGLANGSISEYDILCQRPFWEIFQIMKEKKAANDALEAQYKKMKNGNS